MQDPVSATAPQMGSKIGARHYAVFTWIIVNSGS